MKWGKGHEWLTFSEAEGMIFCSWCRLFDRNGHRNQFVRGCSTMKVESVKKREQSQQHKDAVQHMAHKEVEQIKRLFNTAF